MQSTSPKAENARKKEEKKEDKVAKHTKVEFGHFLSWQSHLPSKQCVSKGERGLDVLVYAYKKTEGNQ